MIGTTIGHGKLKLISELGRGGMGVLYLAEHVHLGKRFAVKSLSPSLTQDLRFRERFSHEAQEQALLDHPNIVEAIDLFEESGHFFFVMEYVDGRDLDSLIKARGRLPEPEALRIFAGILEGLKFAHGKEIIHRDVKPSNILIDEGGRPRITDFGIAILVGGERLTATGAAIGTPWYMSPEQILHPKDIDHRSDIYSAGIVLFEMLTGEVPFDGETDFSVKDQQVNSPPPDPRQRNPRISPRLAEIVLKALAKNPDDRFQDCGEFWESLETVDKIPIAAPAEHLDGVAAESSAPSGLERHRANTMSDIFLSYAQEDRDRAKKLAEALKAQGWTVFWDPTIPAGQTWRETIGRALAGARCVVVAWSKHSIESHWVCEEAEEGKERQILVPVLLDNVKPPMGFRSIQVASLVNWGGHPRSDAFRQVVYSVAHIISPPKTLPEPSRVREPEPAAKPRSPAPSGEPTNKRRLFLWAALCIALVMIAGWAMIELKKPYPQISEELFSSEKGEAERKPVRTPDSAETPLVKPEATPTTDEPNQASAGREMEAENQTHQADDSSKSRAEQPDSSTELDEQIAKLESLLDEAKNNTDKSSVLSRLIVGGPDLGYEPGPSTSHAFQALVGTYRLVQGREMNPDGSPRLPKHPVVKGKLVIEARGEHGEHLILSAVTLKGLGTMPRATGFYRIVQDQDRFRARETGDPRELLELKIQGTTLNTNWKGDNSQDAYEWQRVGSEEVKDKYLEREIQRLREVIASEKIERIERLRGEIGYYLEEGIR